MTTLDYTSAIRDAYADCTADDIRLGRDWYPAARRIVDALADWSGMAPDRLAAMVAALSPRNPWRWNVQDAAAFAVAIMANGEMPTATTFGQNRRTAWAFGHGDADWKSAAPKVRSFVANIMGDTNAVTVDVWAIRVATRGTVSAVRKSQYETVAEAYRTVAAEVGMTPRDLQAVVWTMAVRTGLGQARKSTHSKACKRGTFDIVRTLVG